MKRIFILFAAAFFLFSCGSESSTNGESSNAVKGESDSQMSQSGCYQVNETVNGNAKKTTFISLEIEGSEVFGEMAIEMTGPNYHSVAAGSMEGTIKDGVITVLYEYEVEGNELTSEEEFKLMDDQLLKTVSPMVLEEGIYKVKDKGLFNLSIPKIDCP